MLSTSFNKAIKDLTPNADFYQTSENKLFQIIVPIFNEETNLKKILSKIKEHGYLKYVVFVNDASTDASLSILKHWIAMENINVFHLTVNSKKEGAIQLALEALQKKGSSRPYTLIMDADSVIEKPKHDSIIYTEIEKSITYLNQNHLGALAYRLEAASEQRYNFYYMSAYSEFYTMQFDNLVLRKQLQLWVINGTAGLFKTKHLISILKNMLFDFETGDLLITVKLMKNKRAIGYYPLLKVQTFVPVTLSDYFSQRSRWERGTTKILWSERKFYLSLFKQPLFLIIYLLLHLALYVGLFVTLIVYLLTDISATHIAFIILYAYIFWQLFNISKGFFLMHKKINSPVFFFIPCVIIHGLLWTGVTMFARIKGALDAIFYLFKNRNNMEIPYK